jgi:hypothetical protein
MRFVLTDAQFDLLKSAVQSRGFTITGTSGNIVGLPYGIKGNFTYKGNVLSLNVTSKPFWVPMNKIWDQIVPAIHAVGGVDAT